MPKVHHVKRAAKSNKRFGIKKGKPYYWWKHRRTGKHVSLTPPRPSQLANSPYIKSLLQLQEQFDDEVTGNGMDSYETCSGIAAEVRQIGENCSQTADNVEMNFPNGCPALELLRERAEACGEMADELDRIAGELGECDDPDMVESIVSSMTWNIQ